MTNHRREHVLIAGVTTRPFAASAARAGYRVTAVDAFGDQDLQHIAEVVLARAKPGRSYTPMQAARLAAAIPAPLAAYTSNFENHPSAVTRLGEGRRLLGNPADILARVRHPLELMRVLRRFGLPALESRSRPPAPGSRRKSWLLKPRRSGGGHGIRRWLPRQPIGRDTYLQEFVRGIPGSVSFAADGSDAVLLGWSRQLVGEAEFGVRGFRYCGSIVAGAEIQLFEDQAGLLRKLAEIVRLITREFRLVGLNGVDFIARRGVPYPTEVNPRFSSSMELIERSTGASLFEIHVQACEGRLPTIMPAGHLVQGKAIVFARHDVEVRRLPARWIADVPRPGERIARGRPVCTVYAAAESPDRCRRLLRNRASAVYRSLRVPAGRAA
jgi:predicted ATP-grasp superfamily ATP-dependent carboligase